MDERDVRLGKAERLRKRREFLHSYAAGEKVHTPYFVLYLVENKRLKHRFGVTASRRVGKAAVRNRIKRRLREAFRLNKAKLPTPCDLVVNVKRSSVGASWEELEGAFCEALETWKRKKRAS